MQSLELRGGIADLRLTLALLRVGRAINGIVHKYRADQPRTPKGNATGGEWTIDPTSARQQQLAQRVSGWRRSDR